MSVTGIYTDEPRGVLIAASADAGFAERSLPDNKSAGSTAYLGIYDLSSGELIRGLDLKPLNPDFLFEPHSAAMDAVFYQGKNFPSDYQGDAFVALHGSWNRADPTGYKVVRVKFENGSPTGWYDNFMTGFWTQGDDKAVVWGRPADVAVAPDGALFVVDDVGGTLWRVTYSRE